MAFTIYPDAVTTAQLATPADTPVPLAAGASMSAFVQLAGHVGADPDAFDLQTTFIRISMSGAASATPPQVELRAVNPSAVTEGTEVNITAISIGTAQALLDGTNVTDAASAYFFPPHANNVYLLKVIINIPGTTLKIKITNNTVAAVDFVWVVGSSDPESQQPWIHADPAALTYTALINQIADLTNQSIQLINRGTGELTVSDTSPAIAAPYTNSGLPVTMPPNATAENVVIGFNAPATTGDTPLANFSFASTDPAPAIGGGHNNQFSLSATTTKLEVALALDDSGSMSWGAGGEDPPSGGADFSRWSELRSATKTFLELLGGFGEDKGNFGIVKFPGQAALPITDLTSYDFAPAAVIPDVAGMGTVKDLLDVTDPFYKGTPMSYALERLQTAPAPYFADDADSINRNTRWMLVMSDGAWNSSPDPRDRIAANLAAKIKVFAAGYGTALEVDYPTLEAISTGAGTTPGGQALQVDAGGGTSASDLAGAFKTALKAGLTSISSPGDPTNILYGDNPEARHPIIITPYDSRAAFVINWNTPDAGRMVLQLITPSCDLITPETAKAEKIPGVTFSGDIRHQLYIIDQSYLRNTANPSQPRHGTWRMIVTSSKLESVEGPPGSEQYAYDVLTESSLKMEVSLDRSVYYAGDAIGVNAKLSLNGLPLTHAAVKLEVTAPGQAMANWLAAAEVSEAEYQSAAKALENKEPSAMYIKAYAAGVKGIYFKRFSNTTTLPMTEAENSGVYAATVAQTATPDSYKLYVTAVGMTPDGVVFRRERSLEVIVAVRPESEYTLIDILYSPLGDNPKLLTATLRVTPRDRFGNFVLIDPETSQDLVLHATEATVSGKFATQFDGTYSVGMSYSRGARPSISLVVASAQVVQNQVIAPVDQLRYVDKIVAFKPGVEGALGANQHTNPKDCLGDFLQKQSSVFVSLGGYGSLTATLENEMVVAQGDDDVTVFAQPDKDMRSYLVEALSVDGRDDWIPLGKSAGTTQSFSLQKAGLEAAAAIRITDTSGRARGADMKPIATPGVSIRGIGFAKTARRRLCFALPWRLSLRWLIILLLLIGGLIGALLGRWFRI